MGKYYTENTWFKKRISKYIKLMLKNHWFFGHTTPLALFEFLASIGKSHKVVFVPKTWTKF